ncbi:MAG: segregation/condensation protein A [Synechococcaceae cyanobacterium]|nr:segregation/condensation protein A [Synechococcaceae cyanobacterium]
MAEAGARLAIRLLQDAAERGDIDPWDVDVIAVVDGFLDQLRQRIMVPRLMASCGGSYEQDLSETSEAFLAASVLVGLKAEVLEASTFPPQPAPEFELEFAEAEATWAEGVNPLPLRPERHLRRRPVAPPPLQRPITLGELIRQLEEIASQLEQDQTRGPRSSRGRRYSDRAAIAQVAALAHREKLPETTAALSRFLAGGLQGGGDAGDVDWQGFDELVTSWAHHVRSTSAEEELDADRVGVFWALLFLCAQGKVELDQQGGLFGPLRLRRLPNDGDQNAPVQLRLPSGSAATPAGDVLAA